MTRASYANQDYCIVCGRWWPKGTGVCQDPSCGGRGEHQRVHPLRSRPRSSKGAYYQNLDSRPRE